MKLLMEKFWVGIGVLATLSVNISAVSAQTSNVNLQGRYLTVISDGDFFASTYVDGRIPGADSRYRDTLTIIPLPLTETTVSLEVSNAVTSAPETLVLAPDGNTAFVVEYQGQRPTGATTRNDLLPGRWLTMIDLKNPTQPQILDRIEVGPSPEAIDVHPSGNWLAIATDSSTNAPDGASEMLQLVPINQSTLGEPINISLESLGIPTAPGALNASYVEWHPSGRYLAVNLYRQNRIVFLEFTQNAALGEASLELWGTPVSVDTDPYSGRFTPDGRHYITANWKRNFEATSLEGRLPNQPSTVSVIRLGDRDQAHQVITTVASDQSSEGIAVSPDGTLVATANMRDTALPTSSPRFTREATVSLFSLDADSGALTKVGDFAFEGVLPEGITFDATGEHLVVATFAYLNSSKPMGGLDIWRIDREPRLGLQYTGRINVPPGAHQVIVSP
jgi:DNA-binding beta-propeller fold protein YncE